MHVLARIQNSSAYILRREVVDKCRNNSSGNLDDPVNMSYVEKSTVKKNRCKKNSIDLLDRGDQSNWPIVNQRARSCLSLDHVRFVLLAFRFPRYWHVNGRWLVY